MSNICESLRDARIIFCRPTTLSQLTKLHIYIPYTHTCVFFHCSIWCDQRPKVRSNYNAQMQCGVCTYIISGGAKFIYFSLFLFFSFIFFSSAVNRCVHNAHRIECTANTWSQGSCWVKWRNSGHVHFMFMCEKRSNSRLPFFLERKREKHRN